MSFLNIAGAAGVLVMGSGISAVVLTLIVAHGGSNGYAEAWADDTTKPNTSAVNFQTDEIRTNTITVPLGANGKIPLRNAAKATNYVVDVQGLPQEDLPCLTSLLHDHLQVERHGLSGGDRCPHRSPLPPVR